ncbi:transglycosylase domain-containing protein [Streptococcus sp. DD13]|uniref:transglycosylase domain-containing protein n=1 Tax=Streptococcus sp. DD13 TaxID=1777881 RepID=UPI003FA7DD9C
MRKEHLTPKELALVVLRTLKLVANFVSIVIVAAVVFGIGLGLGYVGSQFDQVTKPDSAQLVSKVTTVSTISKVTYSDNSLISEVSSDLLRRPVSGDAISDYVKQALIATEDASFYSHNGVVPKAVIRAAAGTAGAGSSSGGSTITQQLVKQQYVGDAPTLKRKFNEIVAAMELERKMSKEEILTAYLNVTQFGFNNNGQNIAGVEEAAQGIFGVSAKDLSIPQAAFIAGLPQSPVVYSPYDGTGRLKSREEMENLGLLRYKNVIYNMRREGYLTEEQYKEYSDYDIYKEFKPSGKVDTDSKDYLYYAVVNEAEEKMYEYLLKRDNVSAADLKNDATVQSYRDLAKQELSQGGYTVKSTVNKSIYAAMQQAVATYGSALNDSSGEVETGSVLMDNKTGAILGFIGGRNYQTNQNNHALVSRRNPGSTVKPYLVYGIAIDQGLMGSASMVSDYPTTYADGTQIMHGADRGMGLISLQRALNYSANIPAFWTYKAIQNAGVDVKDYMDKMNYPLPDVYNIESLPLGGGIDVTVAENTNAYQTLVNGGVYNEKYIVESITAADGTVIYQHEAKPVQVYSAATSSIMNRMLREVLTSNVTTTFQRRMQGLNPTLANSNNIIGKTGTSNNFADVWLMIASPNVTLGTWSGHDDNTGMSDMSGYNNNSQYVANLVNEISKVNPQLFTDGSFQMDSSVVTSTVVAATGLRPGNYQYNGRTYNMTGPTTQSYWAKGGAPAARYDFMIGGTSSDKAQAWASLNNNSTSNSNNNNNSNRSNSSSSSSSFSSSSTRRRD